MPPSVGHLNPHESSAEKGLGEQSALSGDISGFSPLQSRSFWYLLSDHVPVMSWEAYKYSCGGAHERLLKAPSLLSAALNSYMYHISFEKLSRNIKVTRL